MKRNNFPQQGVKGFHANLQDCFKDALVICNLIGRDLDCDNDITPVRPISGLSEGVGQLP
jgi:hypothetical protein